MSSVVSERIKQLIQKRIHEGEEKLREVNEWIERLKSAGFNVSDLETRTMQAQLKNDRLRDLL